MLTTLLLSASGWMTSCGGVRVVMVPEVAGALRVGPDVRGHMYVLTDGEWVLSRNKVHVPEGWFVWHSDAAD